jgi:hypothetical protein
VRFESHGFDRILAAEVWSVALRDIDRVEVARGGRSATCSGPENDALHRELRRKVTAELKSMLDKGGYVNQPAA